LDDDEEVDGAGVEVEEVAEDVVLDPSLLAGVGADDPLSALAAFLYESLR
jgi:hypothetical protein